MKKEKNVKQHTRRLKSGKVITVKAHKAKYDAVEDLKNSIIKKKGSGLEMESLKNENIESPFGVEMDDFKEWYAFNDWDAPKKEWPDAVRRVDKALLSGMGKKSYDDFCAKVDESWTARGYRRAMKDLSALSKFSVVKQSVSDATKGHSDNSSVQADKVMDKVFKQLDDGNNKGSLSGIFGMGYAKLYDSKGNVIGVTIDTPNAVAHAMANDKRISFSSGILGETPRSQLKDRFWFTKDDKSLGSHWASKPHLSPSTEKEMEREKDESAARVMRQNPYLTYTDKKVTLKRVSSSMAKKMSLDQLVQYVAAETHVFRGGVNPNGAIENARLWGEKGREAILKQFFNI